MSKRDKSRWSHTSGSPYFRWNSMWSGKLKEATMKNWNLHTPLTLNSLFTWWTSRVQVIFVQDQYYLAFKNFVYQKIPWFDVINGQISIFNKELSIFYLSLARFHITEDFIFDGVPKLHPLCLSHGAFRYSTTRLWIFYPFVQINGRQNLTWDMQHNHRPK